MNKSELESKITVSCPSGHRLRGGLEMVGETVSCPKCQTPFVFAPTKAQTTVNRAVTDTGVMRILGDMPQPPSPPMPAKSDDRAVTDTGVMRILGDVSELPSTAKMSTEGVTRPCSRCGVAIQESLAVCPHCNCYLGVKPSFLKQMSDSAKNNN